MKWTEAKIIYDFHDKQLAVDLISDIFYDLGLKGVVVGDPDAEPDEGWGDGVEKSADDYSVTGYFPKNEQTGKKCRTLENELVRLENENRIKTSVVYMEIDEEDWAESWKTYFWPEKITENIVVRPTWREYNPGQDETVLEIDPGMAFGTGTHPTTALCIGMIEKYLKPGNTFLDIGTGSGILMIAAAKLGAEKIWGTDTDEVAVEIAEKNLLLNKIKPEKFRVANSNLADIVEERFDIVAANILSEVIIVLLDDVRNVLADKGIFICSGIIKRAKDAVVQKMADLEFEILEICEKEEWVSIAARSN
ncbi:MAG: 50S ribosomal protein L11 methyltransferase [Desulfobacterales bacterium]|nr:50S ribosomal protein L11 methyltransferase [Desulfobacterales bacterium]